MIIHALTIIFVVLFWNISVTISCFNKSVILPISVVVLLYVFSIYLLFKMLGLFNSFSSKVLLTRNKVEAAKADCVSALVAYAGSDFEKGKQLWQNSAQYLQKDTMFQLFSCVIAQFDKDIEQYAFNNLGITSFVVKKVCVPSLQHTYSKMELNQLISEFKLPWVFRQLIEHYLSKDNCKAANVTLKQFFNAGNLTSSEWKILKASILEKEAQLEQNGHKKIRLYKKANRLNKTVGVFELVEHYQKHGEQAKARALIEEVWKISPSVQLGKIYMELDEFDIIPIHKFQHARALGKFNENHPITHVLIATYAVESELWSIAYEALKKFKQNYPALALLLLARLEFVKSGDNAKIWENIEKAFIITANKENLDIKSII